MRLLGGGKASFDGTARKPIYRVLEPDENVWKVQSSWSTAGRFLLERRDELPTFEKVVANSLRCMKKLYLDAQTGYACTKNFFVERAFHWAAQENLALRQVTNAGQQCKERQRIENGSTFHSRLHGYSLSCSSFARLNCMRLNAS